MSELVSIVVPVYNAEKYIKDTVDSVLAQTYDNWELILVENGSTDGTPEILKEFKDPRIKCLWAEGNIGAARARNWGVENSTGRFVGYIDADDLWVPDKLEKQIKFMTDNNIGFCFTGYEFGTEDAKPTGKIVIVPDKISYKQALRNTTIFTSTVIFDTTIVPREKIDMPIIKSEDTALWFKLLREGYEACGLNENLTIYRRPANSLSSNKLEAVRRIWNLYRKSEKLNFFYSCFCMIGWGFRAVKRRI